LKPTFAYCAARYLDLWARKESDLCARLRSPTAKSIRDALAHFNVSRGFPGIARPNIGAKVAELLVQHDRHVSPKTAPLLVQEFASALEKLGYDNLLSAASKLLWLRSRSPFLIVDSRAVRALKTRGPSFEKKDYASYAKSWRVAYSKHEFEISKALTGLPRFVQFTAAAHLGRAAVAGLVREPWFAERTFDQYLWLVGAPKTDSTPADAT
jgi:hypothetical protein